MTARFEWVVPSSWGLEISIAANATTDTELLNSSILFDAYASDDCTIVTVKGHFCFTEVNAATPEINVFGWRVRMGLEDLNVGGSSYAGSLDTLGPAEEHFLDERFWSQGSAGTSNTNMPDPYYTRFDVKSKRKIRHGQTLGLSFWNDANVVRRLKRFIRVGVLLHT